MKFWDSVLDHMCSNGIRWFWDLETEEDDDDEEEVVTEELDLFVEVSIGVADRRDHPVVHSDNITWRSLERD